MPVVLKDLVSRVAKAASLRNHEARRVVDKMLSDLREALARGETVELRGLGTFEARWVEGRKGRDWKTGKTVELPPMRRVTFRPGRLLRPQALEEEVVEEDGQMFLFGDGAPRVERRAKKGKRPRAGSRG